MIFDLLFAASAVIAIVALLRLRAATFMFAANQLSVLRALGHIDGFGQPRSQGFLPASVFSTENLAIAANLFVCATLLLAVCVSLPAQRGATAERLPPVPRWLSALLLLYFALLAFSSRTIFSNSYTDPERVLYGLNLSGAHQFLASIFLYEIVRRSIAGELSRLKAFALLLATFISIDYLKGQTGLASGFMVASAFLVLGWEPRPGQRWLTFGGAMLTVFALALVVRGVRSDAYEQGASRSIGAFADSLQRNEEQTATTGEGAELYGNGTQYAAHVLECISLYEAGVSREWRSVYLPIVYTFQPSFLVSLVGIERPKEAAWELADYYIHGGGIFVLGELYWNGGYLCAALVYAGILGFAYLCDTRARHSFAWLLLLCQFAPGSLQGMGYGFAQVSRGLFNGLLALGIYWLVKRARRSALPRVAQETAA